MTRFRTEYGSIVNVPDELAARIGAKWTPADAAAEAPEGAPQKSWTVDQLKAYASEHDVDLGDAKKKADILALVTAVADDDEGDGDDESDEDE